VAAARGVDHQTERDVAAGARQCRCDSEAGKERPRERESVLDRMVRCGQANEQASGQSAHNSRSRQEGASSKQIRLVSSGRARSQV